MISAILHPQAVHWLTDLAVVSHLFLLAPATVLMY